MPPVKVILTIFLLQVPWQLALEIMSCHNSLSSSSFKMLIVFDCPYHRAMPSKIFSLYLPLALSLLVIIFAVVTRPSKLCLLITCPINRACCVLISFIKVGYLLTSINALSLVRLAIHGISQYPNRITQACRKRIMTRGAAFSCEAPCHTLL